MGFLKTITISSLMAVGSLTLAQDLDWSYSVGGAGEDYIKKTRIDNADNLIMAGTYDGTVDIGIAGASTMLTSLGSNDAFVAKYDTDANIVWSFSLEAPTFIDIRDMAIDDNNNIIIVGGFAGTFDFDPGTGTANETAVGNQDIFIAKYNTDGDFLWVQTFGQSNNDSASNLILDAAGNSLIVGTFAGNIDFDPGSSAGLVSSPNASEIATFLLKLDASGAYVNAFSYWYAIAKDVDIDAAGNIFVAGSSTGNTDYDLNFSGTYQVSPNNTQLGFVTKCSPTFVFDWVYIVDGTGNSNDLNKIIVDNDDNIHVTGGFQGQVDFDPTAGTTLLDAGSGSQTYHLKLSNAQDLLWINETVAMQEGYVDADNNVYMVGSFQGTVDFDGMTGVIEHTANGIVSGYVQKVDEDGNLLWVELMQSIPTGLSQNEGITADSDGNIYVSGWYLDSVYIFQSNLEEYESVGGVDAYVFKINECNIDNNTSVSGITITSDYSGASYQWLDCDNANAPIAGETAQSFTPTQNGNYACEITDGTCTDTTACVAISSVGLNEASEFDIKVYPNPTEGLIYINTSENIQLAIYDTQGKLIMTSTAKSIDLSGLKKGVYILKIKSKSRVITKRIIKK